MSKTRQKRRECFGYCVYPRVRRTLRNSELTRKEAAQFTGISESAIWYWLTGKNQTTIETIRMILKLTGLRFEEAFSEIDGGEEAI